MSGYAELHCHANFSFSRRSFSSGRPRRDDGGARLPALAVTDHNGFDAESGEVIADVACGEDEFGIWISGAVRRDEANQLVREQGELDRENILLRSFRLPDPPMSHLGQDLTDFRFVSLADLAIAYIRDRVVAPAFAEFGDTSAADQSAG